MVKSHSLAVFGLPQVRIYANGNMFDSRRNKWIEPQPSTKHIEIASPTTKDRVRLSYEKVFGYFFRAPWRTGTECRWLKPFGFSNYYVTADGRVFSKITWNYVVGNNSFDGYRRALLKKDSGGFITIGIHRLVAMAFLDNPENKPEVDHIDGNKQNNNVKNLRWVWGWENVQAARETGLRKSVLTDEQIHEICKLLENHVSVTDIMHKLGVSKASVLGIKSGCHFRISKDYNIPRNRHFGAGHRSREASNECYRIARKTHGVNVQPSRSSSTEGSETIPEGSRSKCSEAVAISSR